MEAETTALRRLGEVLLAEGSITEAQLAAAIEEQERTGQRLGEILLAKRNVSRMGLANAVMEQHADARRSPGAHPATASGSPDLSDPARKLAQLEELVTRLVSELEDQGERLAALETLIPANSEALGGGQH